PSRSQKSARRSRQCGSGRPIFSKRLCEWIARRRTESGCNHREDFERRDIRNLRQANGKRVRERKRDPAWPFYWFKPFDRSPTSQLGNGRHSRFGNLRYTNKRTIEEPAVLPRVGF